MVVTHHAEKRIRQRSGLRRKAVRRFAARALHNGYRVNELKGPLAVWVYSKILECEAEDPHAVVFGDKLFLFTRTDVLVTVLQLPADFIADSTDRYIVGKAPRRRPRPYMEEYGEDIYEYEDYTEDGEWEVTPSFFYPEEMTVPVR